MDIKNLSSKQVWWTQKLFQYHFGINYCQNKANGVASAFSKYFHQSAKEKATLKAKKTKILHYL